MGWTDKALREHKIHRLIEQAMNTPEYKEARKKDIEQATLQGLCRFCFLACEYLELKHGYKHNGLLHFLDFAKVRVVEIGEDEDYFDDATAYYKDEFSVDVLGFLGIEKVGGNNG